ncbi:MAG: CNNM domain-containing protein [Planctomycetota bacterium]
MIIAACLLAAGIFLSAFFSGSETGFYRVTRVRLLMDAKTGSLIARSLLWLIERPTVVVATVLIGNNIANYLVSLGLVLLGQQLLSGIGVLQTFLPVLATPFLFIYGELLPKYLYYNAPYALSRRGAPLMVLCAGLFLPISILVIALERAWQKLIGIDGSQSKLSLERQELQRVMMEGQEAGILVPSQQELAQNLFTYGGRPVRQFAIPARALPIASTDTSPEEMLQLAKRMKQKFIGIRETSAIDEANDGELQGCIAVSDLLLCSEEHPETLPVLSVENTESTIQVLLRMQGSASPLAQVCDAKGKLVGIIYRERLNALLVTE